MKELTTLGNLSRTSNTPLNSSRNTGAPTTLLNRPLRLLHTMLKRFGNRWKYLLHPAKPAQPPTISGNPMTTRNTTLAVLKLITSLSITMAYFGTRRMMRKARKIGREFDISKSGNVTWIHVPVAVSRSGAMDFICLSFDYFALLDLISCPELFSDSGS